MLFAKADTETRKAEDRGDETTGLHTGEETTELPDYTTENALCYNQASAKENHAVEAIVDAGICQQPDRNIMASPAPVAPPRKKRQQKKEARAKDSSAPPKPPPPRPKNPPTVAKSVTMKEESVQETSSQLDTQPCITVNSNTTDMNKMLLKGSANEVVKNQDLDECKSPLGSKMKLDKEDEGW